MDIKIVGVLIGPQPMFDDEGCVGVGLSVGVGAGLLMCAPACGAVHPSALTVAEVDRLRHMYITGLLYTVRARGVDMKRETRKHPGCPPAHQPPTFSAASCHLCTFFL